MSRITFADEADDADDADGPEAELTARDRPYERFGQQGFAMPDHRESPASRGAERLELGEAIPPSRQFPETALAQDASLEETLAARLASEPRLDATRVVLVVHHREVTIAGTVRDGDQRERAVRLVTDARGVTGVVDRLSLRQEEEGDGTPRR